MTEATVPTQRYVEHAMGMPVSLALRGRHTDDAPVRAAWVQVMASLHRVDEVFSTYRPDSYVSRLARCEIDVVDCPEEVHGVLTLAEQARQESGGAFDISWQDAVGETVLDPSGLVKGWAVERAARFLAELPDTDWCLSAGGDMVCHVASPASPEWRIGIEHPLHPTRILAVVPVRDGAVATSGSAHRGAHIVDPRTGATPTTYASVTVVADSLLWADVDATAAYVLGPDAPDWLASRPHRRGVLVHADGRAEAFGEESPVPG